MGDRLGAPFPKPGVGRDSSRAAIAHRRGDERQPGTGQQLKGDLGFYFPYTAGVCVTHTHFDFILLMRVGTHAPWHACGGQKTDCSCRGWRGGVLFSFHQAISGLSSGLAARIPLPAEPCHPPPFMGVTTTNPLMTSTLETRQADL